MSATAGLLSAEVSKIKGPHLDWRNKLKTTDTTFNLGPDTTWVIETVGDTDHWRAFKYCYEIGSDTVYWVPLFGWFHTKDEAVIGVRDYIATQRPVCLDAAGNEIQQ